MSVSNEMTTTATINNINYHYYVSHDILSEYDRACQPQHDSWSKFVHDTNHYGDVSIEWWRFPDYTANTLRECDDVCSGGGL